jgi:tRNA-dihydrouridine synthase C
MSDNSIFNRFEREKDGALILPGPMEGVLGPSWLTVLTAHRWIRGWWTPFLRISTGVPRYSRLRDWLSPYLATDLPVIAQLMGCDSNRIAQTGKRLAELGAAALDLNCACPSREVVTSQAGGWHLQHPVWIGETLRAMRVAAPGTPICVKLRAGWSEPDFVERIAPILNAVKPDLVAVHFRTVAEGYRPITDGLARLTRIRAALPGLVVLGSGDLFTTADIRRMLAETGVDGALPARGLLKNPRLLHDYAQECAGEQPATFDTTAQLSFLREIAQAGATRGFILQLAANFFGPKSDQFQQLLANKDFFKNFKKRL